MYIIVMRTIFHPSGCADILEMELPISVTLSTSQPPTLIPISSNEHHFGEGDCLTDNIDIVQDKSQENEEEGHSDLTYSGSTRQDSDTTTSGQCSSAVLCP